jgi:phenylalanyl-tRNA synthetase beta chain
MYISHSWLKKYLPNIDDLTPDTISEALTGTLAEVEKYELVRDKLTKVFCGEIVEVDKMENSNKLTICKVDIGDTINTIICGAPNVKKGLKVAVCLPGGTVYNAHSKIENDIFTIEEKPMLGVTSQGMICSPKELGLYDNHDIIIELESELKVGTDLVPLLKDVVYEIENKSLNHRPDCFSHLGIARELSAILNINLTESKAEPILAYTNNLPISIDVKVEDQFCPRFMGLTLSDVVIKQSPLWLQSLLTAIGMRPINNVVDITNYIMFDKGQPMHAYDYDKISGHKLIIRQAKEGEMLHALNDKKYKLNKDMVVVADDTKIQDLAGIMGGKDSEVSDSTTKVVLEAANFNMYNIRRTSRELGLRSEASTRYEKGQDPNNCSVALKSAIELLLDLTNSEIASELIDIYSSPRNEKLITFDTLNVKRFLGIELSKSEIINIFTQLQLGVTSPNEAGTEIEVTIPTFRNDLNIQNDLLEEIARIYGYARIIPTLPKRDLAAVNSNSISVLSRRINNHLVNIGVDEVLSYSFVNPVFYEKLGLNTKKCLQIQNPISPELSLFRTSIVPSLLSITQLNSKKYDAINIFEINRIVEKELDKEGIHNQPRRVAVLNYDKNSQGLFLNTKGILESLLEELSIRVEYKKIDNKDLTLYPITHKYRSAGIYAGDMLIGIIGEISPKTMNALSLKGNISFFELDFDQILVLYRKLKNYSHLSIYPEVYRDLSYWVETKVQYSEFIDAINSINSSLIKSVNLVDVFVDVTNADRKGITFSLVIQSQEKTLSEDEINKLIDEITSKIKKEVKSTLRDGTN